MLSGRGNVVCVAADPKSSSRIRQTGRKTPQESLESSFFPVEEPGLVSVLISSISHHCEAHEEPLHTPGCDADTGHPCWGCTVPVPPLEMPNLSMVWTHSLESKLISHSDLLYLNKSHVPATTQTAKK